MCSDRLVAVLATIGRILAKLRKVRGDDDMHELADLMATEMRRRLGDNERRCMAVASVKAAEPIDQEYIGWVLGGPAPLEDSKYPYWQMFLAREDDDEENRAACRRSDGAEPTTTGRNE